MGHQEGFKRVVSGFVDQLRKDISGREGSVEGRADTFVGKVDKWFPEAGTIGRAETIGGCGDVIRDKVGEAQEELFRALKAMT